jgi:hypothetical protein
MQMYDAYSFHLQRLPDCACHRHSQAHEKKSLTEQRKKNKFQSISLFIQSFAYGREKKTGRFHYQSTGLFVYLGFLFLYPTHFRVSLSPRYPSFFFLLPL